MKIMMSLLVAAGGLVFLITGCGQAESSPVPVGPPTDQIALESWPVGPVDSTLKVWTTSTSLSEYTVSNFRIVKGEVPHVRVDVTVRALQGSENRTGFFSAMNKAGVKTDQEETYGDAGIEFVWGRSLVPGETQKGTVDFVLNEPTTIYVNAIWPLNQAPSASWKVN